MILKRLHEFSLADMLSYLFLLVTALTYYFIAKVILGLNQLRKSH